MAAYIQGKGWRCPDCEETKPRSAFYFAAAKASRVSHYCKDCTKERHARRSRAKVRAEGGPFKAYEKCGRRWTKERIIESIREWAQMHGGPPGARDWHPALARVQGSPRAEEIAERFGSGCWPSSETVKREFGTWNAGIEAAGFTPLQPGKRRA